MGVQSQPQNSGCTNRHLFYHLPDTLSSVSNDDMNEITIRRLSHIMAQLINTYENDESLPRSSTSIRHIRSLQQVVDRINIMNMVAPLRKLSPWLGAMSRNFLWISKLYNCGFPQDEPARLPRPSAH